MISWHAVLFGSVRAQCMTLLLFREGKINASSSDSAHRVSLPPTGERCFNSVFVPEQAINLS